MNKFDINTVIAYYKLNLDDIAPVLFPRAKYPKQALLRITKGEASISIEQLEMLASYIGVLTTELLGVDSWKGIAEDNRIVLLKGQYRITFNYEESLIDVFKDGKFVTQFLAPIRLMTVNQFITELNNQIKNYENGNN